MGVSVKHRHVHMYMCVMYLYQLVLVSREWCFANAIIRILSLLPCNCYKCCFNLRSKLMISNLVFKNTNEDTSPNFLIPESSY